MIADLTLRWVVTLLFTVAAAECILTLVVVKHHRAAAIGHGLHLLMAIAMAVMAWPRGAALPTTGPMVVFLFATVWFLAVAAVVATTAGGRLVNGYHAVMMFAMAWMYAVMNGSILPGHSTGMSTGGGHGGGGHAGHAGHGGSGADMPAMEHSAGAVSAPAYIDAVNWFWTVAFAGAAVFWIYRYFATRRTDGGTALNLVHFGTLCQAAMAAGMSIMFGVML
ncbi:DUF5134 domain-containing protein [Mycolicibacterium neoaurum]|uniref:DUF5134 domain-containing protein n=1 Tax=Mycolicibacterium neoaurum TaxID=1795 RepID=UPI00248D20C4|nr:DUF5134 domain-containing protein [Mycolicibacterium neoaurum]WBP92731.1 DUF5134 domain-containing protein [Mycolicibacterium neoaurum]WBS06293.1 DUF5134 domain-containing protein [Mycolicibacterium neoaurum]